MNRGLDLKELDEAGKPVLIYVTVKDPKLAKKVKVWEESQLSKDNLIIGVKVFDCYMVAAKTVNEDAALKEKLGKQKSPGFFIFHKGKLIGKCTGMPKSSAIFNCLKKAVNKVYKTSLDKVVAQVAKYRKEREKIDARKRLVLGKMSRIKEHDTKGKSKATTEMDTLTKQEEKLKAAEKEALDLEKKLVSKK